MNCRLSIVLPFVSFLSLWSFLSFSSLSSFAAAGANVGGLMKVDSGMTNTLVAVPWVAYDAAGDAATNAIALQSFVKTRNLVAGDTVMTIGTNGVYGAWTLNASGGWDPLTTVVKRSEEVQRVFASVAASEHPVGQGTAVWLVRCGAGADVAKPVYFAGQFSSAHGSRTLPAGTWKSPARSLVSVPTPGGFDLNDIQEGVGEEDEIDLVTDTVPVTYKPKKDGDKWVWGWEESVVEEKSTPLGKVKVTKAVRRESDTVVPFGRGFWYLSRGGAPVIGW